MLLCNGEDVQGESASKGYVEQGWRDVDVSKQEQQIVVSVVLVVTRKCVAATGPHSSAAVGLILRNAVCVLVWTVLT